MVHGMPQQIITPKNNSNLGYSNMASKNHGAIIQNNNRMLDSMIKKQ